MRESDSSKFNHKIYLVSYQCHCILYVASDDSLLAVHLKVAS